MWWLPYHISYTFTSSWTDFIPWQLTTLLQNHRPINLGPFGPRWAPCWPHEPCYQGCFPNFVEDCPRRHSQTSRGSPKEWNNVALSVPTQAIHEPIKATRSMCDPAVIVFNTFSSKSILHFDKCFAGVNVIMQRIASQASCEPKPELPIYLHLHTFDDHSHIFYAYNQIYAKWIISSCWLLILKIYIYFWRGVYVKLSSNFGFSSRSQLLP